MKNFILFCAIQRKCFKNTEIHFFVFLKLKFLIVLKDTPFSLYTAVKWTNGVELLCLTKIYKLAF